MRMPETVTLECESWHLCGFPVRICTELTNVKVTQTQFSKAEISCRGKVTYIRTDTNEPTAYCPGCGRNFPKAGEA